MSEPESKLDLTALSDALGDGAGQASVEAKKEEETKEEQGSIKKTKPETDSPETLSPTSPGGSPPPAPRPAPVPSSIPSTTPPVAVAQEEEETTATLSPEAQSIKAMFPDFDAETIAAVLAAEGGHQERAINTLLSMSDPTYVAPPPAPTDGQTQSDEQLARSLAMAEQQQQQQQQQHQSQQQQRSQGGFAGLFSGAAGGASSSPQSSSPGYDSSNLTYQPRVRKAPGSSGGGANAANASTTRPPLQSTNSAERRYHEGESLVSGWPGPREAKAWQEDLNKLAESSLSRAASTFTALRQRGEQAWAQTRAQQQQQQQQQPGRQFSSDSSSAAGAAVSPTMGSSRGFDRDASPVGDNELAKILARGREDDGGPRRRATGGDGPRQQQQQQQHSVADRYKNVLRKNSSPATAASRAGPHTGNKATNGYDDGEDDSGGSLSWDDAGRTGAAKKTFEPIQIADNSAAKTQPTQRNAVSLMESSAGRGLTSPRASTAAAAGAGAGAGAATGAAALAGKKSSDGDHDDGDDDDDDDDLEYVANPFEDED